MNSNEGEPAFGWRKYVVAIAAVLVAALARYLLGGVLGDDAPLLLFTLAVVVAGWVGGLKPGLLATAAALVIGLVLFVDPVGSVLPLEPSEQFRAILFVVIGVSVSWLCENLHAARRRVVNAGADERTWKARYEAAVEASGCVLYDYDYTARRATFGGSTEAVLGVPVALMPKDFAGFLDLVHPDDRTTFAAAAKATEAQGGTFSMEYRLRRSDGEYVSVQDDGKVIGAAGCHPARVIGLLEDVTEQRRASSALRETSQQLLMSLKVGHAAAFTWDIPANTVEILYDGVAAALRLVDEPPVTFEAVLAKVHPDDRDAFARRVRQAVERPGREYTNEYRRVWPDGVMRWICDTGHVEFGADGKALRLVGLATDITDRKQAVDALRASEHRLRLAMEAAATGMWDWDLSTGAVTWSPECYPVFGLAVGAFDGTAAGFERLVHADDKERVWAAVGAATQGRTSYEAEFRIVRPDGQVRWVNNLGQAVYDDRGQPVRMVGTVRDITGRKTADERVQASEERLRHYLDHAPASIAVFNADMRYLYANRRWLADFKLGDRHVGGLSHYDVFPDIPERWREVHRRGLGGEVVGADEERFERLDGSVQWLRWEVRPWHPATGDVGGIIIYTEDITERKQAESRLRVSEERFRTLADSSPVLMWQSGPTGVMFVNRYYLDFVGVGYEAVAGSGWTDFLHPDDFDVYTEAHRSAYERQEKYELQCRMRRHDGQWRWLHNVGSPHRGPDGAFLGFVGCSTDVTDMKRAEEQVDEARHFLLSCIDALSSHIAVLDEDGVIVTVNEAWRRFADANEYAGHAYGVGANYLTVNTGECGQNGAIEGLADVLAGRRAYFEVEYPCHSATVERWFVMRATPFRWEGRIRVVVAHENVTERRQAEAERQRVEVQYRSIVEGNPALICRISPDGRLTFVNDTYCRTFNRSRESLVGHRFTPLVPEEDRPGIARLLEHLSPDMAPYTHEHRVVLPDGRTRWQRWTNKPVADTGGAGIEYLGIGFDITDRKRAEERSGLLSEAAAALLVTDEPDVMLQGLFARVAPPFGLDVYFNYMADPDEDALRLVSAVGITDDQRKEFARMEYGQAVCGWVAANRTPYHARYVQLSEDPREQVLKGMGLRTYSCHPLVSGGVLLGTLAFGSRSKNSFAPGEVEFLHTICNYVTAAYERLRLVSQLRQTDRHKDEFLATLAHELRNPLAPIRNGLQIMKLAGADAASVEKSRSIMERQVGQMSHLIDDLMDLSRIGQGKIMLQKTRLKVADAVQDAIDISRPLIDERAHELVVEVPPEAIYVDADRTRLAQVFGNLLNNAAKYTPTGGRIRLAVERRGGDAVVTVEDNGVGIPAQMLNKVFDMFAQVDRSLEKAQGGLGIGLNIVKRLVAMHDGSITVASRGHDKGSEFTVHLPLVLSLVTGEKPQSLSVGSEKAKPLAGRRILVVDDNHDGATSLAEVLDLMGSVTQTAFDGAQAVAAAEAFAPDVILMDIGMPKLNGYEACRRIRSEPWGRNIVIVAQTGWGQEDDKRKSKEAGFDFHMVKPVDPAALAQMLVGLKTTTVSTRR